MLQDLVIQQIARGCTVPPTKDQAMLTLVQKKRRLEASIAQAIVKPVSFQDVKSRQASEAKKNVKEFIAGNINEQMIFGLGNFMLALQKAVRRRVNMVIQRNARKSSVRSIDERLT